MKFRIVNDENDIYKDEGSDNGLVMSVDWAHIMYGNGNTLYVANGGTQLIDSGFFEVLKIYVHPESDSIWLYCMDVNSNTIWNIEFNDLIKYESGLGIPPLI